MIYPPDAITISKIIEGEITETIIPTIPNTILGINISQENLASNTHIYCGSDEILDNFAKTTQFILLNKVCNSPVMAQKIGNDKAQIIITYVPYNLQTSSSTLSIYNGFTSGEIVNSLFLFLIFLTLIFGFVIFKFLGFKIHKQV